MLKPILGFAVLGVAGILLLPVIGIILGFVITLLKIGLVIFLIWLAFKMFEKMTKPRGPEIVS
jgi:threonine/homoserine/homoserine lactone efflux protein